MRIHASGPLLEANRGQFAPDVYFPATNAAVSTAIDFARVTARADGTRRLVETRSAVQARRIAFEGASHRRDPAVVIDPVIDFSYIVNGNGDDRGCQVALDGAGNIYIAGLTRSPDFETTPGAAFGSPVPSPGGDYDHCRLQTRAGRRSARL
jgi:hypothetical protein